jgi:voltage-gated potassium channel
MERALAALTAAFHDPRSTAWRTVDAAVWLLIVASIAIYAAQVMGVEAVWLSVADHVVLWLFAAEITLRVLTYRPRELDFFSRAPLGVIRTHVAGRLRFLLRPLNLFDLLAVVALAPELRGLRALRLLRLVRKVPVFNYSSPLRGLLRAFEDNALLYAFAFSLFLGTTFLGGLLFFGVESRVNPDMQTLGDALWWAIVTLTTVGFGDIAPVTPVGRGVGAVLMVAGMFNLALFAGIVGHTLLRTVLSLQEEQFMITNDIDHIVVCGYDSGARVLLDALLAELGTEAPNVTVFASTERATDVPPQFRWVRGDPAKEAELDKVRMTHARAVLVVGARDQPVELADAQTILTTFTIRSYLRKRAITHQRRRPLYVGCEIFDPENVEHARTAGADEVIETNRLGFTILAHAARVHGTADLLSAVASPGAQSVFVSRPPSDIALPRSFGEVCSAVQASTGALVIGIRRAGDDALNPDVKRVVSDGDELIYLAAAPLDT